MAGTYIQQDVRTPPSPLPLPPSPDDRRAAAVALAIRSCAWVVVTALYQPALAKLMPPNTSSPHCWLAFVDRPEHSLSQWTAVPLLLFHSYERNENFVKVMLPAVFPQPSVFLNHVLPEARCFTIEHLVRARELHAAASSRPHLFASKIPSWSGRSLLSSQLALTRDFLTRRNHSAALADLQAACARMAHAGLNLSSATLPRITDTLWMVWPTPDEAARRFSRLWAHEVALYSSFEKVSYPWVLLQVAEMRVWLTDAVYIYSPLQRCGSGWVKAKPKRALRHRQLHA
ncbi:hypothetical protein AB1Y20_013298 [Prymnesium parvum]|uniref:Mannosyltransferase n=1 Tax=Prymnesium parvum TaxID=97485 RepID=A0AB34IL88_PRYPA